MGTIIIRFGPKNNSLSGHDIVPRPDKTVRAGLTPTLTLGWRGRGPARVGYGAIVKVTVTVVSLPAGKLQFLIFSRAQRSALP